MQLTGPQEVVFPDGSGQQPCAISATGATGTVTYTVTEVPSQVVAMRKTATSAALAVGASLTAAEAAALVATRSTSSALGPNIGSNSVIGVRSRVYPTGSAAPAFTVSSAADVQGIANGNFWVPNFPTGGTGTLTVELLFDTGTAITLGNVADIVAQLGYGDATSATWGGTVCKAICSTDGSTVSVLNALSATADQNQPLVVRHHSGAVSGAASARWFGIQLTLVPIAYPLVIQGVTVNAAVSGSYTPLPQPVYFGVQGKDGAGGSQFSRAAITGIRSRVYASGSTAPAFTVGSAADVSGAKQGNFWIPNFPTSGTGTLTVDLLFDYGSAITLGNFADFFMQLDYTNTTTNAWSGVVAKAIASTDGTTVTQLNTLTGTADTANPKSQIHFAGAITGAPSARWFGIRLTLVPKRYPLVFFNVTGSTAGTSTASIRIPIGDTTTNFGTSSGTLAITSTPIVRLGASEVSKALGLGVTGGTAPYTITVNTTGMIAPLSLAKTAAGASLSGSAVALTVSELQGLLAKRSSHTEYIPGNPVDYRQAISVREVKNGAVTLLNSDMLAAFKDRNFFGVAGGPGSTDGGFLAEMPAPVQIGSITNMPMRYGYGDAVPAGTVIEFITSTDGVTLNVAATIPLPGQGAIGNYYVTAIISGAPSAKFWGLRFKYPAATDAAGIGFYDGDEPAMTTPPTPYQAPDAIASASTFTIAVSDSTGATANATVKVGGSDTVVVEAPAAAEPAIVELQELVGSTWTSRGTLALTGRVADIVPDSGMKFEGTNGSVWVSDPATALPVMGNYEAWGVRFGWGSGAGRKYSYVFGLKPNAATWPNYPFGDVTQAGRQTVPSQLHRWIVKTASGGIIETLDWNGSAINDPAKSPKQFWSGDAAGNLNVPAYRPYHIGQGVMGWYTAPNVRSSAGSIFPKVDSGLEFTFRNPGVTNPSDYTMALEQVMGLFNIYAMEADGIAVGQYNWTSEDPEMVTTGSRHISSAMYGYKYRPGQTSGRDVTTGPGGVRNSDRCVIGDPFARVIQSATAVRPHRNVSWATIAREQAKSHVSENCFHITNARFPKPLKMTAPGDAPQHARFYYGVGDLADPQSLDLNSGRSYEINGDWDTPPRPGQYALSKTDPSGWLYWSGQVPDFEHNYPFGALGALVFESPAHWWIAQFHFLQSSMVLNREGFLTGWSPGSWLLRPHAWPFANAAYIWAIQDSSHAMAVISRADLEAKLKADLIHIADVEIPQFNADPANLDSLEDYNRAMAKRFGGIGSMVSKSNGPTLLPIGYLCQGLELWKKFGLWDRMRSLDPRCATALDFILGQIAKATVDLLLDAPHILAAQSGGYGIASYQPCPWPATEPAPGTPPSAMVQSWAAWAAANPTGGANFWQMADGSYVYGIGQYHVLHCVTALKRVFGFSYPRLDTAETTARQLLANRIAAIRTLPVGQKSGHLGDMMVYQNVVSSTETGAVTTF